jgi:hypothetical protein
MIDQTLNVDISESSPSPLCVQTSSPAQLNFGFIAKNSPRVALPAKALLDAGYSPGRNEQSKKYAKYFFSDDQVCKF